MKRGSVLPGSSMEMDLEGQQSEYSPLLVKPPLGTACPSTGGVTSPLTERFINYDQVTP